MPLEFRHFAFSMLAFFCSFSTTLLLNKDRLIIIITITIKIQYSKKKRIKYTYVYIYLYILQYMLYRLSRATNFFSSVYCQLSMPLSAGKWLTATDSIETTINTIPCHTCNIGSYLHWGGTKKWFSSFSHPYGHTNLNQVADDQGIGSRINVRLALWRL